MTDYIVELESVQRYQEYFDGPLNSITLEVNVAEDKRTGKDVTFKMTFDVNDSKLMLRGDKIKYPDGERANFSPLLIAALDGVIDILDAADLGYDIVNPIDSIRDKQITVKSNGGRV